GDAGAVVERPADTPLKLIVFGAGADRNDPSAALFESNALTVTEDTTLLLIGTIAAGDATPSNLVSQLPMGDVAPTNASGARFTCVELEERAYGFCQQICTGGVADYGQNACQGE